MKIKISDLMSERVIHAQRHHSVAHVRKLLTRNHLHAVPVVDSELRPIGIVSSFDLMAANEASPVSQLMTTSVHTIPQYNDVQQAARAMRNHRVHHLVVTHEQQVVGMISSFDLLRLVEEHRFVMKPGPTPPRGERSTSTPA